MIAYQLFVVLILLAAVLGGKLIGAAAAGYLELALTRRRQLRAWHRRLGVAR